MSTEDLSQFSMLELFRMEVDDQAQVLVAGLLALEREPAEATQLEVCMRAAHSLKGAARIIGLNTGVSVAHAMEDCFVAAQQGRITLRQGQIDLLLRGVDLLRQIATAPAPGPQGNSEDGQGLEEFLAALARHTADEADGVEAGGDGASAAPQEAEPPKAETPVVESPAVDAGTAASPPLPPSPEAVADSGAAQEQRATERVLRVTADNLNRLLALAGESLVASRWLTPFHESLLRLKRQHADAGKSFERLRELMSEFAPDERAQAALDEALGRLLDCQQFLRQRLAELEQFDRRAIDLSHRLYGEAVACRMRPFADGVQAFPRLVRDLARTLGKQVRLELRGEATPVDRDILERLDAPLGHLLRNAVDHGIETPAERLAGGKPAEGCIVLEARHSAGMLLVNVLDDGRGIDLAAVRRAVVERRLTNAETASRLSEEELLEFLFLPGFSMKESVTQISGRGVGLDAVQDMVKQVRGSVRIVSRTGHGTHFQLQLPLTLSVVRTLLVEIGGEPYAFPLAYIDRTLKLPKAHIELIEDRQHFPLNGRRIGLVGAHQVLGCEATDLGEEELSLVVIGEHHHLYGLLVDRFLGEQELVVQPLDPRLGKIKDISAGALMEDGSPVLIVDVADLIRSVEKLVSTGQLNKVRRGTGGDAPSLRKRVLVVDDSLTVRELERKLLGQHGYEVEVAVDGMDGWNAVRAGHFDLVVTDIDMPRMDGIELVTLIRNDPALKALPAMVVSYKDREEDRRRGLEAGADYYLAKGSFHDETLLQAVTDLIGEAER
ncbi:hybrid sensor histidine kinase/response regulator [Pseudogulbenkiania sp. MAI-1]|uniref:hybrid sensor histidine kinase/response regulator n=1 Tax=Pseudogulbenkiania sp. MAI-1 TaxID=990370 RepID=UPI00045E64B8|nr:hybrid sensor histidine kinase/response regulator [Pseudogulbenkiania sp. MAI-1]